VIVYTAMLPQTEREEQLIAYGKEVGKAQEQVRIVKIVERLPSQFSHNNHVSRAVALALSEIAEPIKGEEQ